jgi:hypothetical protein
MKDNIIEFRLSRWLITHVGKVLRLLHRVEVVDVATISEVYDSPIFRDDLRSLVSLCVYITLCFEKRRRQERYSEDSCLVGALRAVGHERHASSSFTGPEVHQKTQRKIFDPSQYP